MYLLLFVVMWLLVFVSSIKAGKRFRNNIIEMKNNDPEQYAYLFKISGLDPDYYTFNVSPVRVWSFAFDEKKDEEFVEEIKNDIRKNIMNVILKMILFIIGSFILYLVYAYK